MLLKPNPRSPRLLALTRIATYAALIFTYLFLFRGDFASWVESMPREAWLPVGIMRIFPEAIVPLVQSKAVSYSLSLMFIFSSVACVLGFKWSVARWSTLVLTLFLFGFRNSFGHAFRSELVLILAQFVFVLSPASDALSIDARSLPPKKDSPDYQWPLTALQLLWVSIFFIGGLSKLRNSGFGWATENFLAEYLLGNQVTRAGILIDRNFSDFGRTLAEHPNTTLVLGYLVLLFELFYPLVFINRFRSALLTATLLFQLGVFVLLGVNFWFYLPLILVWLGPRTEERLSNLIGNKA